MGSSESVENHPTPASMVNPQYVTYYSGQVPVRPNLVPGFIQKKELVVIAMDFGMTFTGYAFAFHKDVSKIYTATFGGKLSSDRVPSTVLLKPDKTFHSFGYAAEDKYSELMKTGKHKDWMYFRHFKMNLHTDRKVKRDVSISDSEGRKMDAIVVFAMIIRHLKESVWDLVCPTPESLQKKEYKWMITIPAIWSDSARQLMREASMKAGIDRANLHLVLEPEAASVYCTDQAAQWQGNYFDKGNQVMKFENGFKYILADLGGGTADICVHEIIENNHLREIYHAIGGALGGTYVNEEFIQFFCKLVGADCVTEYRRKSPESYLELLRDFETKKKTFSENTEKLVFSINPDFLRVITAITGEKLEAIIPQTDFAGKVVFNPKMNKLMLARDVVKKFFQKSVEGIVTLLQEILAETNDPELKTLILVGGYSESPYLKEFIMSDIKSLTVLQDPDAGLAVLKGAVISGFKPKTITERRARFTYGFHMIQHFEPTQHAPEHGIAHDGTFYCDNIFLKKIEKGQILSFGQAFTYTSPNKVLKQATKKRPFLVRMAKSTKKNPKYCTEEEGCSIIGQIKVNAPPQGWPDTTNIVFNLIIGETEFIINVVNEITGEVYEAGIDFL